MVRRDEEVAAEYVRDEAVAVGTVERMGDGVVSMKAGVKGAEAIEEGAVAEGEGV